VTIENPHPMNAGFRIADRITDLWESSPAALELKRLQTNPRVKYIFLAVPVEACPGCQGLAGTYPKEQVPNLPFDLCSHPLGCRAFYLPCLDEIYP
jgi:hypothetical protein